MASIETAVFCTNAEYERRAKSRIKNSNELNTGSIFMLLGCLDVNSPEAVKVPARIEDKTRKNGLTIARLSLLGSDLNTMAETSETFLESKCYIEGIQGAVFFDPRKPDEKFRAEQAYLQDFFEGLGNFMDSQTQELSLAGR